MRSAFAAVLLAAATLLSAQVLRQPEPVPRTAPNSKAFETFNRAHGNRWQVEWNRVTGTPHRISGSYLQVETAKAGWTEKLWILPIVTRNRARR